YLVILTESNDIAQALWGRAIGRRRITPGISPHKTWEGFAGGVATTVVLAFVLAPYLTGFSTAVNGTSSSLLWRHVPALAAGLLIALAGFLGDINMSA